MTDPVGGYNERMEAEIYKIKTENFEGPFHLLLSLIEERKFFINDLSLAQVTEGYLNYVKNMEKLNPSEVSSFIVVAATLILIKSKSLLPNLNLTSKEEGDIHNLADRLKLYELYMNLSVNVKNMFGKKMIFTPMERKNEVLVFLPDEQITKESMMTFAREVLGKVPNKILLPEVEIKKVISIEEMISKLTERIERTLEVNFKDFAGGAKTREEKVIVIIGFLAMLELVRQGILHAAQDNNFEDIIIKKRLEIL